jgi:hypothetical protein
LVCNRALPWRNVTFGGIRCWIVGGGQQRLRDCEAKRLGGLELDGQLDFYGLLDRQVGWFLAFKNAPGITGVRLSVE